MSIVEDYVPKSMVPNEEAIQFANQFQSPPVMQMQPVVFYAKGWRGQDEYPGWALASNFSVQKDPQTGETQQVVNLKAKIYVLGLGKLNNVPHINDPRLGWNQEQRRDGAWDFTPHDKAMKAQAEQVAQMLEQAKTVLARAEELATAPAPKTSKPAKSE